jgi:iron uptake system EfeUOB component EfeO/EfeM
MVSIDRGDVDQMSFKFRTLKDRWLKNTEGEVVRDLLEVQLFEVSPVTFPAYPQTEVGLRDLGVDPKRYAQLSARAKAGELDDQDKEEIRAMIKTLSAYTEEPQEEPDPSDHSSGETAVRNTELIERERYYAAVFQIKE